MAYSFRGFGQSWQGKYEGRVARIIAEEGKRKKGRRRKVGESERGRGREREEKNKEMGWEVGLVFVASSSLILYPTQISMCETAPSTFKVGLVFLVYFPGDATRHTQGALY